MTPNPCHNNGDDCPNRCVGCKITCEAWREWTAIHERERTAIREKRERENSVIEFFAGFSDRSHKAYHETYSAKKRRERK